jgi:hypothetical protein
MIRSPPFIEGEGGWKIFLKNSRGNKESWR